MRASQSHLKVALPGPLAPMWDPGSRLLLDRQTGFWSRAEACVEGGA